MVAKRVVVIASGETERRALPHITRHLCKEEGIDLQEVCIPPHHHVLDVASAEKLVLAAWFYLSGSGRAPDKFVVLVDADARDPADVTRAFESLPNRVHTRVPVPVIVTAAKWHLEAWFFAGGGFLREYLGRDLGSVDPNAPDGVVNPKLHLTHLLGDKRPYVASVAEEIAKGAQVGELRRSASFCAFESALRNGRDAVGT
jgi:hypothetical protein